MASTRRVPSSLQDLKTAAGTPRQLPALKRIKYDLTGHLSRKVEYIQHGLVPTLAKILTDTETQPTSGPAAAAAKPTLEDELTFTQVAQVLCVIAHEGPPFVQPLLETDVLQRLISFLLLPLSSKATLAILKCLNAVADNLPPSVVGHWPQNNKLADLLYSEKYIRCFGNIIGSANDTMASQQACDAILALLCKTVSLEPQKRALVDGGVLTLLSARLASFVVAEGLVPPGPDALNGESDVLARIPEPAPSFAHLSPVLESLCVLTEHSKFRTRMFLANPTIKTVLPDLRDDFSPSDIRRAPWGASYFSGAAVPRSRLQGPFDPLLPSTPVSEKSISATQSGFPPLSSVTAMPKRRASFFPTTNETPHLAVGRETVDDIEESAVISWLLYVVRESRGKRRLLAAKLLVNLYRLNFVKRERGSSFASLLVPLLTRMLNPDPPDPTRQDSFNNQLGGSHLCNGLHYTRAVPAVLAALVMDDPEMQRVAVEGRAIVHLSAGLKMTFDGPAGRKSSPWQPHKSDEIPADQTSPGNVIGRGGPTWATRREMDYREGCLQALAAIAPFEDDYRKEICDQGVLAHIIMALEPYHIQLGPHQQMEASGNSAAVILAACGAVRVLTRSVQALRTKLIEAEVAKPIIKLMSSTNSEVRIAATRVLTNLAIDFSPVKESVGESTLVKKLCEQAHSANARLRLESLWALKQLVLNASKKLKQDVVDELGSSWIKLLIKTDPIDIPDGEVIGLVEREYPPLMTYRRPSEPADDSQDVIMGEDSDGERESGLVPSGNVEAPLDQPNVFDIRHTTEDDTEIQAQLLDLLRNLFCGENASDLVKYIFDEMGQEDFLRIMLDRLRPRTSAGPTRKENYTTPAPSSIVVKVLYILVHIGACDPKWRNVIASQHALMKQVLTFCSHADREIRAQCCWIAINLTYEDDASDRSGCKQRAIELQKAGFVTHLRKLEVDPDLNVRERAKSAIHLMSKLMTS
ncbi:uncharacterized protein Z518_11181 [Rhinocladiella mackenziei CBS 650.93]|uniref:Uncharacterized protein n=1 Tax=Rhinocladiella mackenziei CBS 650.93 TaxID=1442369 RepID=A0A0D2GM30_9EURO|nr:uncharacterized protein Z518_11181 [Rhinocladiella mackenziei CBS 650.93]KIW99442.1 hypothetical protein Z518_11181 [Rhinocladiella mackenziei CBS 650.93]